MFKIKNALTFFSSSQQGAPWFIIEGTYSGITQGFFPLQSHFGECYDSESEISQEALAFDVTRTMAVGQRVQQRVILACLLQHKDRKKYLQGDFAGVSTIANHSHIDYLQRHIGDISILTPDKEILLKTPTITHSFCYISRGCKLNGLTALISKLTPGFKIISRAEYINDKKRTVLTLLISQEAMCFLKENGYLHHLIAKEISLQKVRDWLGGIESDIEQSTQQKICLECLVNDECTAKDHLVLSTQLANFNLNRLMDDALDSQYPLLDIKILCQNWQLDNKASQQLEDALGDSYLFTGFICNGVFHHQYDTKAFATIIRLCLEHIALIKNEDLSKPLLSMSQLSIIEYYLEHEEQYCQVVQDGYDNGLQTPGIMVVLENTYQITSHQLTL